MQKIYCRSIRPDGYGEGVVPETICPQLRHTGKCPICESHMRSSTIYALIHPDLHKGKVGWVGECRERCVCPDCGGDGKETCHNPDHGFIDAVGGELRRLGCPVCGHDNNYKVNRGKNKCNECVGSGIVSHEKWDEIVGEYGYDADRRLILVPVEGKEPRVYNGWNDNKSRVAGIGGQPVPPGEKVAPVEKGVYIL